MEYKMINFVESNTCLYDKSSIHYKCRLTKLSKWKELSNQLGVGVPELQKRWKTLRDRFRREDKKHAESGNFGAIKWEYYKALSFLKGYEETEILFYPSESCPQKAEETSYQEYVEDNKETNFHNMEDSRIPPLIDSEEYANQEIPPPPLKKKKPEKQDNRLKGKMLQELNSILDRAKESFESKSMVKCFFNCMANQVEQANLSFDRLAYVQQEVLRIVNEQIKEQRQENVNGVQYQNLA